MFDWSALSELTLFSAEGHQDSLVYEVIVWVFELTIGLITMVCYMGFLIVPNPEWPYGKDFLLLQY